MAETFTGLAALAIMGFTIAFGVLMLFMALVQPWHSSTFSLETATTSLWKAPPSIALRDCWARMKFPQPIWCVVDCAVDGKRGTGSKVVWIILLIVLYGLANWFYGAFAASGRALRRLTRLAWVFAILLLIAFAVLFHTHGEFRRGIEQQWRHRGQLTVKTAAPAQFAMKATDER